MKGNDEGFSNIIVDEGKCANNSSFIQLFCTNLKLLHMQARSRPKLFVMTVHHDTIRTTKSGDINKQDQILRGPEEPILHGPEEVTQ